MNYSQLLICANDTGSLVNSLFGVKNFNLFLSFTSLGGMVNEFTNSYLSPVNVELPNTFFYHSSYSNS